MLSFAARACGGWGREVAPRFVRQAVASRAFSASPVPLAEEGSGGKKTVDIENTVQRKRFVNELEKIVAMLKDPAHGETANLFKNSRKFPILHLNAHAKYNFEIEYEEDGDGGAELEFTLKWDKNQMKKAFKRDKPKLFSYPIEDIEGIGEVLGEKLKDAGAHTTKELLAKCASSGHAAFAKEAGLSEGQIRKFAAIADLMQVRGISTEYGELVHLVGIETFTQLPGQDPVALAAKMEELVKSKALVPHAGRMVRKVPTAKVVANWIDEAQKLAEAQNLVDANLGTGTSSGAEGAVGEGGPNAKWPKT